MVDNRREAIAWSARLSGGRIEMRILSCSSALLHVWLVLAVHVQRLLHDRIAPGQAWLARRDLRYGGRLPSTLTNLNRTSAVRSRVPVADCRRNEKFLNLHLLGCGMGW